MKKFLQWLVFVGGMYVLQISLLPLAAYHGISVDLLLLITVSFSFLRGGHLGVLMGFLLGLLQDLATGTFFGMNIFSKMVIGYFCGSFSNRVFKEQFFLPVLASLVATALNYFILALVMVLLGYRFNLVLHMQMVLLPMLGYNVLLAYPVHRFVYALCEKTKEK